MKFVYFTHSLVSCWNNGNAHFLRGLLRELVHRGHCVRALEPADSWSRKNLEAERGPGIASRFAITFPELASAVDTYEGTAALQPAVDGADVVIVHEWTEPKIIAALSRLRMRPNSNFTLLFHDTHHRAVSNPDDIAQLDLEGFDGILAFGRSLADVYERRGWRGRVFVLHEAADVRLFKPLDAQLERAGAVWIGNWGDDERSEELATFLLKPAKREHVPLDVFGVRYPASAADALREYGARYLGWLPNDGVPEVFARHLFTLHVPRRFYSRVLPGIPTIRVFEALACGIPLASAPWDDCEGLFSSGRDYLSAATEQEMSRTMRALQCDADLRQGLSSSGLQTVLSRHTCSHRADDLLAIVQKLKPQLQGAA